MSSATALRFLLSVVVLLLVVGIDVRADTFTVDDDGPADFAAIQAAIDAAQDGDCITVEPGTYVENIDFLGKAITVQSSGGPDVTIIDGNQAGSVVTFASQESLDSILEGFTITNGDSLSGGGVFIADAFATLIDNVIVGNTAAVPPPPVPVEPEPGGGGVSVSVAFGPSGAVFMGCVITGNTTGASGGGLRLEGTNDLIDCTVSGNEAGSAGGIDASGSLSLTQCTVSDNSATSHHGGLYIAGSFELDGCLISDNTAASVGGMGTLFDVGSIENTVISGNVASDHVGGISAFDQHSGGTLTVIGTTICGNTAVAGGGGGGRIIGDALITQSTISGNTSEWGGGLVTEGHSGYSIRITDCSIISNSALGFDTLDGVHLGGGGVFNLRGPSEGYLIMTNCKITDNFTNGKGGALNNVRASATLTNCTMARNSAEQGSGVILNQQLDSGPSFSVMTNCIAWGNIPNEIECTEDSEATVTFSDFENGYPGTGNIDVDPLFVDADGPDDITGNVDDDFRLAEGSPCIDAGTNDPAEGLPATDIDGNPRVVCTIVDMGAYEAPEPAGGCAPAFLRGDSDGDGIFNAIADGLHLLTFGFLGGPPPPCLEAADADGDAMLNALADASYILLHGFVGGPPPGAPYPLCGFDPQPANSLGCGVSSCP